MTGVQYRLCEETKKLKEREGKTDRMDGRKGGRNAGRKGGRKGGRKEREGYNIDSKLTTIIKNE